MTTDALTETVLDEAEAIVRAEWIRVHHDDAASEHARCPVGSEMPAARTRLPRIAPSTAIDKQTGATPPRRCGGWAPRCAPQRRIWPTQRSPPQADGNRPSKREQRR
ncbi:hypothetical protein [Mycolicibacterium tusciae]|uniref:hypothetical protein n=1 Tax=Mycolicibacterium tusciae TaxID=75922 RepID=UPI00024A4F45|nr:hypothetical protein [Mycolicibacterium tusciae]